MKYGIRGLKYENRAVKYLPAKYNDRFFRRILAITGAYFVTEFGGEDGYFSFSRLLTKEFYVEFGSSVVIALTLVELISWITRLLDRRYDWRRQTVLRISLQALLGVVLPGIIDFLMASIYFRVFGVNILDTTYLQYSMPYIILMITSFNLAYVVYYFYRREVQAEKSWRMQVVPAGSVEESFPGPSLILRDKMPLKEVFIVHKGSKSISVPVEDICYFFHENDYNFLRTFAGDISLIRQSLDEVELAVSDKQFFRLNRQMIINYKAFLHFVPKPAGKLKVFLKPSAPDNLATTVSQKKSPRFKDWIDR